MTLQHMYPVRSKQKFLEMLTIESHEALQERCRQLHLSGYDGLSRDQLQALILANTFEDGSAPSSRTMFPSLLDPCDRAGHCLHSCPSVSEDPACCRCEALAPCDDAVAEMDNT